MRARHIYVGERRCWILTIVNCVSMKCNSFVSQWSCASYFIAHNFSIRNNIYIINFVTVCTMIWIYLRSYGWIDSNFNILNDINWCMVYASRSNINSNNNDPISIFTIRCRIHSGVSKFSCGTSTPINRWRIFFTRPQMTFRHSSNVAIEHCYRVLHKCKNTNWLWPQVMHSTHSYWHRTAQAHSSLWKYVSAFQVCYLSASGAGDDYGVWTVNVGRHQREEKQQNV